MRNSMRDKLAEMIMIGVPELVLDDESVLLIPYCMPAHITRIRPQPMLESNRSNVKAKVLRYQLQSFFAREPAREI